MKTLVSGGTALPFLNSVLDVSEWAASCPDRFTFGGRAYSIHCYGDWVDPGAGPTVVE
jgi:hypothetical protein